MGSQTRSHLRLRFWVESALGALSATLAAMTLFWKDWIEIVLRVDPDHHSGSLELSILVIAIAATLALSGTAGIEWRHARRATTAHAQT